MKNRINYGCGRKAPPPLVSQAVQAIEPGTLRQYVESTNDPAQLREAALIAIEAWDRLRPKADAN